MKNNMFLTLILFLLIFLTVPVYASNDIDYTLTITDDFKFSEVIKYKITDYREVNNGYNYFVDIINKDKFADVLGKTYYTKKKTKTNGVYNVTLSKVFTEYTMSNSALLNNCFQKPEYEYDINTYSFSGDEGFYCTDADNLTITIITNFNVTKTNAIVNGNKYVWKPTDTNFTMNIEMEKKYKEAVINNSLPTDLNDKKADDNGNNELNKNEKTNKKVEKKDNKSGIFIVFLVVIVILGISIIIIPILKVKKDSLNKI